MSLIRTGALALSSVALVLVSPVASAKKQPELSPLAIQQMQTRDFEFDKSIVFSSVMTVLQDSGYRIGSADKETGLITGTASTNGKTTWMPFVGFGRSKKTPVVSAFIEEIGPRFTKVRFNFVMTKISSNGFGSNQDEEPILDQAVYQQAFEKVDQAIFVRTAALENAKPLSAEPVAAIVSDAPQAEVAPNPTSADPK
ncbi:MULTISPECIES: hypothetical protein [unclassified Sphingopyxis]|jgi:hypothetical protein|uniref:hypothetical protein n=1 Tax=unclassified Sphingopyxis TaxID=2614943 RepID=UPI0024AC83DC|nr:MULTISPECIES: hypothetical protein [unclassified Sphingopyxis]